MLVVKANNYAYDVWFEVIRLDVELNELTISDHLLGEQIVFSVDNKMEFKVMEDNVMRNLVIWYLEKEKRRVITLRDETNYPPLNSAEEHQLLYYQQLLMSINKVIKWLE